MCRRHDRHDRHDEWHRARYAPRKVKPSHSDCVNDASSMRCESSAFKDRKLMMIVTRHTMTTAINAVMGTARDRERVATVMMTGASAMAVQAITETGESS